MFIFELVEQLNVQLKNWLNNEITKNKYKTQPKQKNN